LSIISVPPYSHRSLNLSKKEEEAERDSPQAFFQGKGLHSFVRLA
jgi:hypothetical protein